MDSAKIIRRELKKLETDAEFVSELRSLAKNENGRMTEFGQGILASAKAYGVRQAFMAKLLDITPGAVSQNFAKL